ncbi:DUF418 domain-containing protein [Rhodocytophaga rosea]|uniref:DUF418 domain-containing protein n=1 Tax=Rhodocytophaga rosea TaxID=2704465 RepID=A0A6C0GFS6_9BACT|nr:DUF418 domain-containing protein [Rhodocytophaga rosea]QHT66807.1 DUF418 domain-containing protein [Rhodocytophaga rosea]
MYDNFTIDPFVNFIQDSPITLVSCFGKILLGFWLGQIDFFAHPQRFNRMMNWWIWLGSTIGIASSVGFWAITTGQLELELSSAWLIFIIAGGLVFQSLLYISLFVKLFQVPRLQRLFMIFAPVGKMTLTNYLMQTIFCLLIFYYWTHGTALFGKITITETYLIAIAIYVVQVLYSNLWLQYFSHGPVEWLWWKLAYRNVKGSIVSIPS